MRALMRDSVEEPHQHNNVSNGADIHSKSQFDLKYFEMLEELCSQRICFDAFADDFLKCFPLRVDSTEFNFCVFRR